MPATRVLQTPQTINTSLLSDLWPPLAAIFAIVSLHLFANGRYGFYRDELQFMSDGQHLDWGFVVYPPVVPLLARLSMTLFGVSLAGLRFFSTLAQAATLIVTALMTRELGGGKLAQAAAVLAVGLSPCTLHDGAMFQYTSFDYLWWVLTAYFTIRLLKSENPRWWLAVCAVVGLGLLTKYTIACFVAGILSGVVFTRARRYLARGWFWSGIVLMMLITLPNIVWQFRHNFISYQFLQFIHARDVNLGRSNGFLIDQLLYCVNLFAAPIWLAGLIGCLRSERYRTIAWMYIVPFALFFITNGRSYYIAPAYPMLLAMGSVIGERWMEGRAKNSLSVRKARSDSRAAKSNGRVGWSGRQWAAAVYLTALMLWGAWASAAFLPIQSKGPLRDLVLKNNGDLMNEFGWNELIQTVAGIRNSLPADQQAHLGILVANYGEEGAVEILGTAYHLPRPISTINSGGLRGYPASPPTKLIVMGFKSDDVPILFGGCKIAGRIRNSEGIPTEESVRPDIFLCGPPRQPWPEFWAESPHFE
jgi:4-amino-4-deoxy-L-arabinose transferase-like glycosyltransferase